MATTRKTTKNETPCPEFVAIQDYARKYHAIGHDDPAAFDVLTIWTMGTWAFSDASPATPYTYPYLYVTGPYGSGKSVLARDVFGSICRNPQKITGVTGPALFRTIGDYDDETGTVTNKYPTLLIDEIDATFYGAANEPLRLTLNEGYRRGATIPRASGRTTISYPVHCPKVLIGANNGKLPASVVTRSLRVECVKHSQDELTALGVGAMFPWDVEDDQAELSQTLADWAKREAMVLRDYRPEAPTGMEARTWEIARSLVQLAKAAGVEKRITAAILELVSRQPKVIDHRVEMYSAIFEVFEDNDTTKVTTRMILEHLREKGISVPGGSGKGLASVLSSDGISPTYIRIDKPDHPAFVEGKTTHRGYHRYQFDSAFVEFLPDEADEDE